jgi:hypothetical protein
MATPFERFESKMRMIDDALQRIGYGPHAQTDILTRGRYVEDQLSRVIDNATRARNYLSEMLVAGTLDTELEGEKQ